MAIAGDQFAKWAPCLNLKKEPDDPDHFFDLIKPRVIAGLKTQLQSDEKRQSLKNLFGFG